MADRVYTLAAWAIARRQVLERDEGRCQIRGPRCTGRATCVDHVVPVSAGGAWYDLGNLRAACAMCNGRRVFRRRIAEPSRVW